MSLDYKLSPCNFQRLSWSVFPPPNHILVMLLCIQYCTQSQREMLIDSHVIYSESALYRCHLLSRFLILPFFSLPNHSSPLQVPFAPHSLRTQRVSLSAHNILFEKPLLKRLTIFSHTRTLSHTQTLTHSLTPSHHVPRPPGPLRSFCVPRS